MLHLICCTYLVFAMVPPLWATYMGEKGNFLDKPYGINLWCLGNILERNALRTSLGTCGKIVGIRWEYKKWKKLCPRTLSPKEIKVSPLKCMFNYLIDCMQILFLQLVVMSMSAYWSLYECLMVLSLGIFVCNQGGHHP